ncbi:MAG: hypothetical protein PHE27_00435 [Alphaproteobacteria bacterium]|nr:hypothetical protein [Alphaproteobacteria bacterium]
MIEDKRRYFIELRLDGGEQIPRRDEAQIRRAQAERFVGHISQWLQEKELNEKVASIAVTALGQVLITCEQDIISHIRNDGTLDIAAIRSARSISNSIQRVSGW